MKKFVPVEKRSKREQKEYNKSNRILVDFNTGSREMKTEKKPSRAQEKEKLKKDFLKDCEQ